MSVDVEAYPLTFLVDFCADHVGLPSVEFGAFIRTGSGRFFAPVSGVVFVDHDSVSPTGFVRTSVTASINFDDTFIAEDIFDCSSAVVFFSLCEAEIGRADCDRLLAVSAFFFAAGVDEDGFRILPFGLSVAGLLPPRRSCLKVAAVRGDGGPEVGGRGR